MTPPAVRVPVPAVVDLEGPEARELARRELSRPEYAEEQPGLFERVVDAVSEAVEDLLRGAEQVAPGGWYGLVALVVVLVAVAVAVRLRVGPLARGARTRPGALFGGERSRTAAEHRAAADEHAHAGRWTEAVRERMRGLVRGLEERALLDERPGRTADEAAAESAAVLPELGDGLRDAARIFDDVVYGERPGRPEHDEALRRLDEAVQRARPRLAEPSSPGLVPPR